MNIRHAAALLVLMSAFSAEASHAAGSLNVQYRWADAVSARFNALLQGWAVQNQHAPGGDPSLRLRRAELKLSGDIAGAPRYFFMIDPARLIPPPGGVAPAVDRMIQDLGRSYAFGTGFEVTAGQFRAPLSAEGIESATELPLPERSLVSRSFGDRREMGLKLGYKAGPWSLASMASAGRPFQVDGQGMFNDLHARAEYAPIQELGFGAFATIGGELDYSRRGRWGVNARCRLGKATFRGELTHAKDGAVHAEGVSAEAGYWITENLYPVARYETYSPGKAASALAQAETIGVNYLLRSYYSKIQVAGTMMQNMAAANGTPAYANGQENAEVTFALQTSI